MKASPEDIAYYERLALKRGGCVQFIGGVPFIPAAKISEKDFQQAVIDMAHYHQWRVAHFRKSRTKKGWTTAVAADGRGFTDLVLVRERIIWAELKVPPNKLTPEQEDWQDWLLAAGQEWYCWYPQHWEQILETLRRLV